MTALTSASTERAGIPYRQREIVYTSYVKGLSVIILLLALVSLSCKGDNVGKDGTRNPVEKYGDDVTRAYTGTQRFAKQMDAKSLQDAIRSFQALNGRYPKDLGELEQFAGARIDGNEYEYDPSAGTIRRKE